MSSSIEKNKLKVSIGNMNGTNDNGNNDNGHNNNIDDYSQLQKPIDTNLFGLKHILSLFNTATSEVQEYITYECEILYECRICRSIFRSLANFILHKRNYCRKQYRYNINKFPEEDNQESIKSFINNDNRINGGEHEQNGDVKSNRSTDDLTDDYCQKNNGVLVDNNLFLEKIDTSDNAVFQSDYHQSQHLMKSEVMEIHSIFENDEVVLGSDGKVYNFDEVKKSNKYNYHCKECNLQFETKKLYNCHIKCKHTYGRDVYTCPNCNEYKFTTAWGVYRHLLKYHRLTSTQVKKLRTIIHSNVIRNDKPEPKKLEKEEEPVGEIADDESQWMNDFEKDSDLQMCGGCGKKFERKAALHSHSQMCIKRIAVCNTIRENSKKNIDKRPNKTNKNQSATLLKGSARRKPKPVKMLSNTGNSNEKKSKNSKIKPYNCENISKSILDIIGISTENKEFLKKSNEVELTMVQKKTPIEKTTQEYNNLSNSSNNDDMSNDCCDTFTDDNSFLTKEPSFNSQTTSEIFEISSDDSCILIEESSLPYNDTNKKVPSITLKRKRSNSCCFNYDNMQKKMRYQFDNDYKEYSDTCFITKASQYMNQERFECIPCKTVYKSLNQLFWHVSLHFSWFRFQCTKCNFMSFNKQHCISHYLNDHSGFVDPLDDHVNDNILPIPKWKSLMMSHQFKLLIDDDVDIMETNSNKRDLYKCNDDIQNPISNSTTPDSMMEINQSSSCSNVNESIYKNESIIDNNLTENYKTIKKSQKPLCDNKKKDIKNRPVRLRTKSVKILHNDFIYDLTKVLKLNDNSIKNSRNKRGSAEKKKDINNDINKTQ